jgi:hypothetical protein
LYRTCEKLSNYLDNHRNIHNLDHRGEGERGNSENVSALSAGEYTTTFPMMVNLGTATGGFNVTITSQVVVYAPAERIEKLLFFSSTLREKIISVQSDINEKKHYTRLG